MALNSNCLPACASVLSLNSVLVYSFWKDGGIRFLGLLVFSFFFEMYESRSVLSCFVKETSNLIHSVAYTTSPSKCAYSHRPPVHPSTLVFFCMVEQLQKWKRACFLTSQTGDFYESILSKMLLIKAELQFFSPNHYPAVPAAALRCLPKPGRAWLNINRWPASWQAAWLCSLLLSAQ